MSPTHESPGNTQDPARRSAGQGLDLLAAAAVIVAALATYWHTTAYYFSQDDFTFLARAKGLLPYPGLWEPFGARVISTRLYFQVMHGLFGLEPGPFHWASLVLHALNALLVYAVARCWSGSRLVALVGGLLFATFDLAFTAVFWISGTQDLLATTFLLLAALFWVSSADRSWPTAILSAAALALSLLCKESGLLFPFVLLFLAWARGEWSRDKSTLLLPHLIVAVAAIAILAAQSSRVAEGGAYGTGVSVSIIHNAATYLVWTADVFHPYKDRVAAIDYNAWKTAAILGGVLLLFLFTSRGRQARLQWAALGWYALAIAPVLPLLRHTYLYYLYPAAPGAAVLGGLAAYRLTSTVSKKLGARGVALGWILSLAAAAALCISGYVNVRARENATLPPDHRLPHDHVLRSATFASNAASSLSGTSIPEGADLILINPYAPASVNLTEDQESEGQLRSYDMVRSALREGLALRLVNQSIRSVDFTYRMAPKWEMSHGFLYDAFGFLSYLGSGADIWANLSTLHLRDTKRIDDATRCGRRALQLDPNHPRANLNLGVALAMSGSTDEARIYLERAVNLATRETIRKNAQSWLDSLEGE